MKLRYWQRRGLTYVVLGGGTLQGLSRCRPEDHWDRRLGIAIACLKAIHRPPEEDMKRAQKLMETTEERVGFLTDAKVGRLIEARDGLRKALSANHSVVRASTLLTVKFNGPVPHSHLTEKAGRRLLDAWDDEDRLEMLSMMESIDA